MKDGDPPRDGAGDVIAEKVEFPVEIGLLRPVEVEGTQIESLNLQREPTALDLKLYWKTGREVMRLTYLTTTLPELTPDEVCALKPWIPRA